MHTDDMPSVIVTGSSGLVGSNVVGRLAQDYQVFCLDVKEPAAPLPGGARFIRVDLTKDTSVEQAFAQVTDRDRKIASVIHLAAYYDFSGEPSDKYDQITVQGTRRMLRHSAAANAEQFVFSSTMLVHRPSTPGVPIDEDWPLEPKWDYPESKVETEKLIRAEHGNMPAVMLRIAGIYSDACDSIPIAHQIQRIYENRMTSHVYPGDTSRGQSFVHIDDVVEAIRLTVENRASLPPELPILIGEPETYSYERLQQEIGRLIHGEPQWRTEQIPKTIARTGAWIQDKIPGIEEPFIKPWMIDLADDHYELNIARARQMLGWEPRHHLIDEIGGMIEKLKADPEAWYERNGLPMPSSVGR